MEKSVAERQHRQDEAEQNGWALQRIGNEIIHQHAHRDRHCKAEQRCGKTGDYQCDQIDTAKHETQYRKFPGADRPIGKWRQQFERIAFELRGPRGVDRLRGLAADIYAIAAEPIRNERNRPSVRAATAGEWAVIAAPPSIAQ